MDNFGRIQQKSITLQAFRKIYKEDKKQTKHCENPKTWMVLKVFYVCGDFGSLTLELRKKLS